MCRVSWAFMAAAWNTFLSAIWLRTSTKSRNKSIHSSRLNRKRSPQLETRTPYQKDLVHLYNSLFLYRRLKNSLEPENVEQFVQHHAQGAELGSGGFLRELELYLKPRFAPEYPPPKRAKRASRTTKELQLLAEFFHRYQELDERAYPLIIPPLNPVHTREDWRNIGRSLMEAIRTGRHPARHQLLRHHGAGLPECRVRRSSTRRRPITGNGLPGKALVPEIKKAAANILQSR